MTATVEIKAIAREAGARTKLAVWSKNPDVDPVGACIGARVPVWRRSSRSWAARRSMSSAGARTSPEFISAALSPAKVVKVELLPGETKSCRVTVPDHQLSLAIGNKGQNVRLCAHLTGYNIDIRPESGYYGRGRGINENDPGAFAPDSKGKEVGYLQQQKQKKDPGAPLRGL